MKETKIVLVLPKEDTMPESLPRMSNISGPPMVGDILKFPGREHTYTVSQRIWVSEPEVTTLQLVVINTP